MWVDSDFDAGYHSHWRRMSLVSSNPTSGNVEYLLGVGLMLVSGWFGASHVDDGDDGRPPLSGEGLDRLLLPGMAAGVEDDQEGTTAGGQEAGCPATDGDMERRQCRARLGQRRARKGIAAPPPVQPTHR